MTNIENPDQPERGPINDDLYVAPKGHQEWLADVREYEGQRDALVAVHTQQGTDPLQDPDLNFVLGKLDVAQDQLKAFAGQHLAGVATEVAQQAAE